jgi:hypothetical protein
MDGSYLLQAASTYAPLATGEAFVPKTGFEGVPGFGGSNPFSMALGIFGGPIATQAMGSVGMFPSGLFHDQNVFDVLEQRRFTEIYRQTLQSAAQAERANYMRTLRGMAALTGTPFGGRQREAAGQLADAAVALAPVAAELMPEFLDELGGQRGSAAVMARGIALAGRYRLDPVTGRLGTSAESGGQLARTLYRDMYEQNDPRAMAGLSAGQAGSLFDELTRRGLLGAATPRQAVGELATARRAEWERLAQGAGVTLPTDTRDLTPEQIDKLKLDPAVAEKLRSFDADKVKQSLRAYASAVSAVRDLFGDAGRPNAPMSALISGLEALTQGQLSQLDPGDAARMVRETHALSRVTGVGIDTALMMQQHAAARAEQLGLNPVFGVQAMQGGLAWAGAYRALGGASSHAWGRLNADALAQLDVNLRTQAVASPLANMMAAASRVSETVGDFKPGTRAAAYVEAVRRGDYQFADPETGKVLPVSMDQAAFTKMLTEAPNAAGKLTGLSAQAVVDVLGQVETNKEQLARRPAMVRGVREAMGPLEVHPWIAAQLSDSLGRTLMGAGVSQGAAREAAARSARVIERAFKELSPDQWGNAGDRERMLGKILEQEALTTSAGVEMMTKGIDTSVFYREAASQFYGHWERAAARSPYRNLAPQQAIALTHPAFLEQERALRIRAESEAQESELLAPLGNASLVRRAVKALQETRPGDEDALKRAISSVLGGVENADVVKGMTENVQALRKRLDDLRELRQKVGAAQPGAEREQLSQRLAAEERDVRAQVDTAIEFQKSVGIDSGPTPLEARRAARSALALGRQTQDLLPWRTGVDPESVTAADVEKGRQLATAALEKQIVEARDAEAAAPPLSPERAAARARAEAYEKKRDKGVTDSEALGSAYERLRRQRLGARGADLKGLFQEDKARWGEYWRTEAGAAYADTVHTALSDIEGLAVGAVTTPEALRKFGPNALEHYEAVRGSLDELDNLAFLYAGGDITRLMAGDLDIDYATPERRAERERVNARVEAARKTQAEATAFFADASKDPAHAWGDLHAAALKLAGPGATPERVAAIARDLAADNRRDAYEALEVFGDAVRKRDEAGRGDQAVGELLKGFGVKGDDTLASDLAGKYVTDDQDRRRLRRLAGGRKRLEDVARRKAGADPDRAVPDLIKAYTEATAAPLSQAERARRMSAFRQEYGLTDQGALAAVEGDVLFQRAAGVLDIYSAEEGERGEAVGKVLSGLHHGRYRPSGPAQYRGTTPDRDAGAGGYTEITGHLTVDLVNGRGDLAGQGVRHAARP